MRIKTNNVLKFEDFEQKQSGMTFCTQLKPTERLIWLYIQNFIENKNPTLWVTESTILLREVQLEDDYAFIISRMVHEGWVTSEEALEWGFSLIQKTDVYLNAH